MLLRRHRQPAKPKPEPAEEPADGELDGEAFDPEQHTVEEVLAFVGEYPEHAAVIRDVEAASDKPRSTLLEPLDQLIADEHANGGEHSDEPDPED
jgi:hypothetical protein